MSITAPEVPSASAPQRPARGLLLFSGTYLRVDLRRQLRNRRTLIFLTLVPTLVFLAFGWPYRSSDPAVFSYIMINMALYGAMVATTSVGAGVASERARGWTRTLRLTPLHPIGYVLVKAVGAALLGLVPIAVVLGVGAIGGAHLGVTDWAGTIVAIWACSLEFAALGLMVGYLLPTENVMQVMGPVLALLSFFGGLFTPVRFLPHALQVIAPYTPTYPVGEIARWAVEPAGLTTGHIAATVAWALLFGVCTAALFRRDTSRG